jgi:hypothetical protein
VPTAPSAAGALAGEAELSDVGTVCSGGRVGETTALDAALVRGQGRRVKEQQTTNEKKKEEESRYKQLRIQLGDKVGVIRGERTEE